jgi:hypothetical protein
MRAATDLLRDVGRVRRGALAAARTAWESPFGQEHEDRDELIKSGGGTANTAFLAASGNPPGGNAKASQVEATFWLETIAGTSRQPDKHQLQYTQLVMLDFNGIHWPHVTVGTLQKQ